MNRLSGKVVAITGASSGFGEAFARRFAEAGCNLTIGARRYDRLTSLADELACKHNVRVLPYPLDVQNSILCSEFIQQTIAEFGKLNLLINNSGLVFGLDHVKDGNETEWETIIDTNVMGILRITRNAIPYLIDSGDGHIINIGSIAGFEPYAGGAVYCATKAAVRAITESLRYELNGLPVRVSNLAPGLAKTEFSNVRFHGDTERADKVYENTEPLSAEDLAEIALFIASRPAHVNIDTLVVKPTCQASAYLVHRKQS